MGGPVEFMFFEQPPEDQLSALRGLFSKAANDNPTGEEQARRRHPGPQLRVPAGPRPHV